MTNNNATGIDIRKAILRAGLNPNNYDEGRILESVNWGSISDWELDSQIMHRIEEYRKGA